jgi:tetratricopeptide (TPR) repeat protein
MSEQIVLQNTKPEKTASAMVSLEKARVSHERYLIRQNANDLQEAITHYVDAVKMDPTLPEAYYRLAVLMWEQGQISVETAIEQCKTAVALCPSSSNAHLYTGYFMKMANDFQSAEAEFKSAIKKDGFKSARPRLILSQSILQKMNTNGGKFTDYMNFAYYFLSGSVMLAWDKPSLKMFYENITDDISVFSYNTVGNFLEKLKLYPKAEKLYKTAIENTAHGEIFYNKMGDIELKNGEVENALDCYRKVIDINPANREVLIKLVKVLQIHQPENTDESIDYYERLLSFNQDTAAIYYELGHLYIKKGDKLNAISAFKLALELEPDNAFYNNSLGYAYTKAELYDDAIECYQKAISLNPDKEWTSIVCQALGSIYAEIKGNIEAAVSTYQAGLILDPTNYDIYISLGDTFMAEYDLDNAIRAYCDAITLNPEDYRGYTKAGVALWEKDYLEEALVAYHKAIELKPDNEFAQNNLGILYLDGIGNAEEALEYFEEAVAINPNYTLAYFNAARASEKMGFINDAANYYQTALDLNKLTDELDDDDIRTRLFNLFNTD